MPPEPAGLTETPLRARHRGSGAWKGAVRSLLGAPQPAPGTEAAVLPAQRVEPGAAGPVSGEDQPIGALESSQQPRPRAALHRARPSGPSASSGSSRRRGRVGSGPGSPRPLSRGRP